MPITIIIINGCIIKLTYAWVDSSEKVSHYIVIVLCLSLKKTGTIEEKSRTQNKCKWFNVHQTIKLNGKCTVFLLSHTHTHTHWSQHNKIGEIVLPSWTSIKFFCVLCSKNTHATHLNINFYQFSIHLWYL